MPLLFPNLRLTQVFGANTDVGKTLLTTALLRESAARLGSAGQTGANGAKRVLYLKPVSTGPEEESDLAYVTRNAGRHRGRIITQNLYSYREPMSPHLAAKLAPDLPFPKDNEKLVRGVSTAIEDFHKSLAGSQGSVYIETAGGVHSPALHPPHTQSTFLQSLRLPSILVASPYLGGISTTLTAYESLLIRGYSLSGVLCLNDPYYRNDDFLKPYFSDQGIRFWDIPAPPKKEGAVEEDGQRLEEWYASLEKDGRIEECVSWTDEEHFKRIEELDDMPERSLNSFWWPFTQHAVVNKKEQVMVIDSAHDDCFDAYYAKPSGSSKNRPKVEEESLLKPYFDGSASWFTQSHGHASTPLTLAAAHAAGRYGHVLFPSGSHAPALDLAEKLKETVGKGWAERVFYSDDGSTGTEVALKMAIRAAGRRYGWTGEQGIDVGIIGLRGGYHGDTIGSMDAAETSTYNNAVDWYKGRGVWLSPPVVQFVDGRPTISTTGPDTWPTLPNAISTSQTSSETWQIDFTSLHSIYDLSSRLSSPLADYYRDHIRNLLVAEIQKGRKFGAVMMEPVCLGAGGMIFVDPLFQACLVEVVRSSADLFGDKNVEYETKRQGLKDRPAGEWKGLPIIYDEVFSGLHRFGYHSAASILQHTPDVAVYAKILTGGLLPLSATLASSSIFQSFLSPHKVDALLHGHSYTANPVGCAVALKGIEMMEGREFEAEKALWQGEERWSFWSREFVESVSKAKGVKGSMAMGTVFAMDLDDKQGGYSSNAALDFLTELRKIPIVGEEGEFTPFQIHSRPLGNVVYLMTSLFTKPEVMRAMEKDILKRLQE